MNRIRDIPMGYLCDGCTYYDPVNGCWADCNPYESCTTDTRLYCEWCNKFIGDHPCDDCEREVTSICSEED